MLNPMVALRKQEIHTENSLAKARRAERLRRKGVSNVTEEVDPIQEGVRSFVVDQLES